MTLPIKTIPVSFKSHEIKCKYYAILNEHINKQIKLSLNHYAQIPN